MMQAIYYFLGVCTGLGIALALQSFGGFDE